MEITEPVILDLAQGRKRVRLELTTRADARDLMKAVERCMERLPDDGEGLLALVEVRELPDVVEAEPEPGCLGDCNWESGEYCVVHNNSTVTPAVRVPGPHPDESAFRKGYAPDESAAALADSIDAGTPIVVDDDEDGELSAATLYEPDDDPEPDPEPVSLEAHRSVRLVRDGEKLVAVESTPCPETHPASGAICIGSVHHGPPCRTTDGDEWVPALAGAL